MEDIAEIAQVGVATVYNYFGTKFDLLRAMLEPEIQRVISEANTLLAHLPDDPLEGIVALARCYGIGPEWQNRGMLEPFAKDYFLSRKGKHNAFQEMNDMRKAHYKKLFKYYKKQGLLDPEMNEDDAIFIISGLYFLQLREMLFHNTETMSQSITNLERRIEFVFSGLVPRSADI